MLRATARDWGCPERSHVRAIFIGSHRGVVENVPRSKMRTYLTHVAFICDDTVYNHRCRKWSLRTLARSTRDSSEICRLDARPTCDWCEPRAPGTTHILACVSYGGSPQQSPRSRANCSRSCCSTQRRCISPLPFCKLVAAREFGQCWLQIFYEPGPNLIKMQQCKFFRALHNLA